MKEMFAHLVRGEVPPIVPFYCPVPTNFDPEPRAARPSAAHALRGRAHQRRRALVAARRVGRGDDAHHPSRRPRPRRARRCSSTRSTSSFIESWIGKEFGPAVSTGQTPDQVGKKRPPVYTPLRGLYLAGCNAGARGVGTELAAASAMECVDRVLTDLGRDIAAVAPRRSPAETTARLFARAAVMPFAWATRA